MLKLTLNTLRNGVMAGVLAAALFAPTGLQATGASAPLEKLWSIVIHFQYDNGFEFDYVLRTGVPTAEMPAALEECGSSHWTGSVVRYHCYPVPE